MNEVVVIQATSRDLYDGNFNPNDYVVGPLKDCGFKRIVLAAPSGEQSYALENACRMWGIELFLGSKWDVGERIIQATRGFFPDVVVRVLLKRFYLDVPMVKSMISIIRNGFDYVELSRDINYELSADVMSYRALLKANKICGEMSESIDRDTFRFAPWSLMQTDDRFKKYEYHKNETWDGEKVNKIRVKLKRLIGGEENRNHVSIDHKSSRYKKILEFIKPNDRVLDVACGQGVGTFEISGVAREVVGLDTNRLYIESASGTLKRRNLEYRCCEIGDLNHEQESFDTVVSLHTMEHIEDDIGFLSAIFDSLKTGGALVLEVPRIMPLPLGQPLYYFHIREYTIEELCEKIVYCGFRIVEMYGYDRHKKVSVDKAREGFLILCKKGH